MIYEIRLDDEDSINLFSLSHKAYTMDLFCNPKLTVQASAASPSPSQK